MSSCVAFCCMCCLWAFTASATLDLIANNGRKEKIAQPENCSMWRRLSPLKSLLLKLQRIWCANLCLYPLRCSDAHYTDHFAGAGHPRSTATAGATMTQGPTILWADCQPTEHWAQLAGVVLVRRYKNARCALISHCSVRPINSKNCRMRLIIARLLDRTFATSSSNASHPIAIGL
jgi:hypothetical protein